MFKMSVHPQRAHVSQCVQCTLQVQRQNSMRRQLSHMGELVHSALG